MSKLLPVTVICLILAALSDYFSERDEETGKYIRKEHFFWIIMTVVMIFFVGLRTNYNDTSAYVHAYSLIDPNSDFKSLSMDLGSSPGFNFVNLLMVKAGFSSQSFLLFHSAFTIGVYLWFLHKYTDHIFLCAFFFITMGSFTFTLAAIRQCIAMAFGLIATDFVIRKKYVLFILALGVGTLFHPYLAMFLLVPFLRFKTWEPRTWIVLFSFLLGGFLLRPLIGTVINIATLIGKEYDAAELMREGVNPVRLIVVSVPVVLSLFARESIFSQEDENNNLFMNLTMLNAEIMFIALFGTANYFARLANYFLPFQPLALPWLFTHFEPKSKRFLTISAILCFFAYFVYANLFNQHFDSFFKSIDLFTYLKSLF